LTQLIMPTMAEISGARRRAQRKLVIGAMAFAAYRGLVIADGGVGLRVICASTLIVAVVAAATSVMHDSNHRALTRSARLNRVLGYSAEVLGASSWLWRFTHNHLHHGNTSVVGVDSDISQASFARLAPGQPWRPWHKYQHSYLWLVCGFLAIKWLTYGDFTNLIHRRVGEQPLLRRPRRRDLALLLAGRLAYVTWALGIPLLLHPWWVVIGCYLICAWVVGVTLAVVFQLAHCDGASSSPSPTHLGAAKTSSCISCATPSTSSVGYRCSDGSWAASITKSNTTSCPGSPARSTRSSPVASGSAPSERSPTACGRTCGRRCVPTLARLSC
jgi:fatty acid desaturase